MKNTNQILGELLMDIRAELKELMETKNYSTSYIATATGVAKSTISMWINDNYNGVGMCRKPRFHLSSYVRAGL